MIKGKKTELTTKKWGILKNGLQGWTYSKKVRWICQAGTSAPVVTSSDSSVVKYPDGIVAPTSSNIGITQHSAGIRDITGLRERVQDKRESQLTLCPKDPQLSKSLNALK